ncbi:unnamed protein product [Symbiodinium sp. CCMP2592]|nr:unnamed protein product [Symbiodinium sp. CCMP2592]
MLLWEYLYWADITIPVDPINWELSREERRRQMDETMLKVLQGVHDKAAWQRRTALGFFQAAAPTVSASRLMSVGSTSAEDAGRSQDRRAGQEDPRRLGARERVREMQRHVSTSGSSLVRGSFEGCRKL